MRTVPPAGVHPKNNFDAIRLIAALFVLVSHQFALSTQPEPNVVGGYSLGNLGVLVFFSISGYLVARSWSADPHAGRFAAKRLLRIWPGYAVVVVLMACVWGPLVSPLAPQAYFGHIGFFQYFKMLVFLPQETLPVNFEGSPYPHSVNGSLWTLPLELKCYVVLGMLGIVGLLHHRWRWLLVALVVAGTAGFLLVTGTARGWSNPMHWLRRPLDFLEFSIFFMAGGLFAVFRIHENPRTARCMLAVCWVLGAAAVAANCNLLALWLVVPTTAVMLSNASTPGLRHTGRFGDLSYGVYIYAFPVQQTLIWLYRDTLSWQALLGLSLAITLTLAFASWHLVEKRALQWKPRRAHLPT